MRPLRKTSIFKTSAKRGKKQVEDVCQRISGNSAKSIITMYQ